MEARADRLGGGQARLEEGQTRLEARADRLEEGQARLEEGQTRLETRMDRLEGRFGNVEGHQYEERATSRVIVRAHMLGIEVPQIAMAQTGPVRQEFHDFMDAAVRRGVISFDEYQDLAEADLILRGRNRRHAVVEMSLGPDEDDISRAVRRSEILHKATSEEVTPLVVTPSPHPAFIQEAESRNAHVLAIPARSGS